MTVNTATHVLVSGRVQGVWFRSFTREQAQKNAVNGWVRNLTDGRVEVHLEGPNAAIEEVLSALHKGPRLANVKELVKRAAHFQNCQKFRIL